MRLRDIFCSRTAVAAALAASVAMTSAVFAADSESQTEAQAPTQTIEFRWSLDPLVPYGLIGGLGGAALLLSLYGVARRNKGALLRTAASAAFTTALLNPVVSSDAWQTFPTEVAIVVDKSASQQIDGRDVMTENALDELLSQLERMENVNVHVIEAAKPKDGEEEKGTSLFTTLNEAIYDIPHDRLGAVFMLTDGRVHDIDAAHITDSTAPLHVLVSGSDKEFDRRIVLESPPTTGLAQQEISLRFIIKDDADHIRSGKADVNISVDGERVMARSVTLGESIEVAIPLRRSGLNMIELETPELENELTGLNNKIAVPVHAIQQNLSVLLLSGAPSRSERAWRHILKSDPSLDLLHITFLSSVKKKDFTPLKEKATIALPTREIFNQNIDKYDLIIFDDYFRQGALRTEHLEKMVTRVKDGGAMLVASGDLFATDIGPYASSLKEILPGVPQGSFSQDSFKPVVTKTGKKHPVTAGLPDQNTWGMWLGQGRLKDVSGDVVMEGANGDPLLVLEHTDKGRVAFLGSNTWWLWQSGYDGGGPAQELMRRLTGWLLKNPEMEEESLVLNRTDDGKLNIIRRTLAETTSPVVLTAPSGKRQIIELQESAPGLWEAVIDAHESGLYRAEQEDKNAVMSMSVRGGPEFAGMRSSTTTLQAVSEARGGSVMRMHELFKDAQDDVKLELRDAHQPMAEKEFLGIKKTDDRSLTKTTHYPIFSGMAGVSFLILLLSVMYARERGLGKNDVKKLFKRPWKSVEQEGPRL